MRRWSGRGEVVRRRGGDKEGRKREEGERSGGEGRGTGGREGEKG